MIVLIGEAEYLHESPTAPTSSRQVLHNDKEKTTNDWQQNEL